jgi:hypothetical protein
MTLHNLYQTSSGEQFMGDACGTRDAADRVAAAASTLPVVRRIAVVRVHPKMMLDATVTKL